MVLPLVNANEARVEPSLRITNRNKTFREITSRSERGEKGKGGGEKGSRVRRPTAEVSRRKGRPVAGHHHCKKNENLKKRKGRS